MGQTGRFGENTFHYFSPLITELRKAGSLEEIKRAFRQHKTPPYVWLPFGGGSHTCIGLRFAHNETTQRFAGNTTKQHILLGLGING